MVAPPLTAAARDSGARDARVDLLRGAALMMVWIDHFEDAAGAELLSRWTLRAWGPSDAAELFVLLSGIVVGLSYSRRLGRDGWWKSQWHALIRAGWLYVVCVLAGLTMFWLAPRLGLANHRELFPAALRGAEFPAAAMPMLTLTHLPRPLQILLLYLVLLPASPLLLTALRRWPRWTLACSFAIYLAVQPVWTGERLDRPLWPQGWYFDPLAWQLLYLLGLWCGTRWNANSVGRDDPPASWRRSQLVAAAVMVVIVAGNILNPSLTAGPLWEQVPRTTRNVLVLLANKSAEGPLRLVHGVAVAAGLFLVLPSAWRHHLPHGLQWLANCGRSSLWIYATGVVLMLPTLWVIAGIPSASIELVMVELDALALQAVLAAIRKARRRT